MSKPKGGKKKAVESGKIGEDVTIQDEEIFNELEVIGSIDDYDYYEKNEFIQYLKDKGFKIPPGGPITINDEEVASSVKIPDEVLVNEDTGIVYVVENKRQSSSGSVLEKVETGQRKFSYWSGIVSRLGYCLEGYFFTLTGPYFTDETKRRLSDLLDHYDRTDENIKIIYVS
tara:strand:- start:332 stop:847 length:516 start_codon:yes stop_codon:yes gene_type:complete